MQQNPPGIDPLLLAELRAGESMLWWGRPDPKRRMKRRQSQNIPLRFGIILAIFLLMIFLDTLFIPDWTYIMSSSVSLVMLVVVNLIVLYSVFYTIPVYLAYRRLQKQLRHTNYAITNQRAIMMTALPEKKSCCSFVCQRRYWHHQPRGKGGWMGRSNFWHPSPVEDRDAYLPYSVSVRWHSRCAPGGRDNVSNLQTPS
jgi:hypothetical protein